MFYKDNNTVSDPMNPEIEDYVKPSTAELKARTSRNRAIALGLVGFVVLVFFIMLIQLGVFG